MKLIGNCKDCCYYTPKNYKVCDDGVCHRYPKAVHKWRDDFCGEFARKSVGPKVMRNG